MPARFTLLDLTSLNSLFLIEQPVHRPGIGSGDRDREHRERESEVAQAERAEADRSRDEEEVQRQEDRDDAHLEADQKTEAGDDLEPAVHVDEQRRVASEHGGDPLRHEAGPHARIVAFEDAEPDEEDGEGDADDRMRVLREAVRCIHGV